MQDKYCGLAIKGVNHTSEVWCAEYFSQLTALRVFSNFLNMFSQIPVISLHVFLPLFCQLRKMQKNGTLIPLGWKLHFIIKDAPFKKFQQQNVSELSC